MGGSFSHACNACAESLNEFFRNERYNAQQFARFRVKHHVRYGQGAFGATFLAHDLEHEGQRVAAKRVSAQNSTREAMQREVDIVMALHHEHIVHALASCHHGGCFWLFMELLEARRLESAALLRLGSTHLCTHHCAPRLRHRAAFPCTARAPTLSPDRGELLGHHPAPDAAPTPEPGPEPEPEPEPAPGQGGELLDLVVREGAIAEARAVGYMVQILRGVEHMHSQGVIHRDLKLDNFMLTAAQHGHTAPLAPPELEPLRPPRGAPGGSERLDTPRRQGRATGGPAAASGARAPRLPPGRRTPSPPPLAI